MPELCHFWQSVLNNTIHIDNLTRSDTQTHQEGHDELVQVDHLDTTHVQLDPAVHLGGVRVAGALGGTGGQAHAEAEHLVAHDGDGLQRTHSMASAELDL